MLSGRSENLTQAGSLAPEPMFRPLILGGGERKREREGGLFSEVHRDANEEKARDVTYTLRTPAEHVRVGVSHITCPPSGTSTQLLVAALLSANMHHTLGFAACFSHLATGWIFVRILLLEVLSVEESCVSSRL